VCPYNLSAPPSIPQGGIFWGYWEIISEIKKSFVFILGRGMPRPYFRTFILSNFLTKNSSLLIPNSSLLGLVYKNRKGRHHDDLNLS